MKPKGCVYILTNPSFKKEWVKIGKSSREIKERVKELNNTSVPLPFEIYATLLTSKFNIAEKLLHEVIDKLSNKRVCKNKEFFNLKPEKVLELFRAIAKSFPDAIIIRYKNNKPQPRAVKKSSLKAISKNTGTKRKHLVKKSAVDEKNSAHPRPVFTFSEVKIPIRSQLVFIPTGVKVKVISDRQIEYAGRQYSLTSFVRTFMPKNRRSPSGAYRGPCYFKYKGEVLNDIRKRIEEGS